MTIRAGLTPSIRVLFALVLATIGLLATAAVATLASRETGDRLREEIGADLAQLAAHMADKLDRGLFERLRDIQVAASLDTMRDPAVRTSAKRAIVERLRSTYPDYAALGVIEPDGRVSVATLPELEGQSVANREFFTRGLRAPFVGDVHDAMLLAKLLGDDPADPARFVDLSAPIRAEDGSIVGVLGAHLHWRWAEELERSLLDAGRLRHSGVDVLVLSRDQTVLLGPAEYRRQRLATASAEKAAAGGAGSMEELWPDGQDYLTGYQPTKGYRDYPGLGWSVLVRRRADTSLAPVRAVQRKIAVWGALVALVTAGLGWFAAGLVVRPLRGLAEAAVALGQGRPIDLPAHAPREIAQVGQALASAGGEIEQRNRHQKLLMNELNHRVKNTLATVQSIAATTARSSLDQESYQKGLEARIMSLSKTHNLLTDANWEAVSLRDVLASELEPYGDGSGERVRLEGGLVMLTPHAAVALGMAAHELATNAAKHGALSVAAGRVSVRWTVEDGKALHLVWKESNGPEVSAPSRRGFGSRLLERGLTRDLNGTIHLDFAVEGLGCTLIVALDKAGREHHGRSQAA